MKTFRLFSMAAVALLMAACSNSDDFDVQKPAETAGVFHFEATIAAPNADASTRTVYTENGTTINVKWKVGDKIALVHNGVVDEAEVKTVDDVTGKATIEADITGSPSDDDDVYLAYPANAVVDATLYYPFPFTPNQDIFDKVKNSQDGTLAYIQNNLDLRMGSGKLAVSGSDVTLKGSVSIPSIICIWKLTLQDESSTPLSATQLTFKNNDDTQAGATSTAKNVYYLCVVPSFIPDASGTFSFEATVGSDTYTYSKSGVSLAAGKYYQSTVTMEKQAAAPAGALSGVFSVSATKKVYFSKGNLQAKIASYSSNVATASEWKFADSQYRYIGNAAANTTFAVNKWVDLFSWVGNSASNDTYGLITFTSNSQANHGNVIDESLKTDWGTAAASSIGTGWRTLSSAEWTYLFNTRTVNGGTGEGKSYTLGQSVNDKLGVVIYPDDYTGSEYAGSDWSTFEAAGCVFLPAAGYREGSSVYNAGSRGYYWSSSPRDADAAYNVRFYSGGLTPADYSFRYEGYSVRLVHDVPAGSQGTEANDRSYGDQSDLDTWQ